MKPTFPLAVFCLTVCTLLGKISGHETERIIGGTLATPGQFPYVVSVIESSTTHLCGGFIYGDRWIVTAASCVYGKLPSALRVLAGLVDFDAMTGAEKNISVYNNIIYPSYNSTYQYNDIAILQLTKTFVFDSNINFITYNEVNANNLVGQVIGWGATTSEDGSSSRQLRYGEVDIIEGIYCGDYTVNEFYVPTMACAVASVGPSTAAGSACHYDEGSPLVQINESGEHVAVGIMSKTKSCSLDSPDVYTRVSVYYSWLVSIAGPQPTAN